MDDPSTSFYYMIYNLKISNLMLKPITQGTVKSRITLKV